MSLVPPMEAKINIRHFDAEDAACVQFVVLSVLQEWGFLPTAKDQQELDALQSKNPFEAFYVAEHPDVGVIGCAGIVKVQDSVCELRKIYLLQRFRRLGIGQQLLDVCLQEARSRQFSTMRLELNSAMAQYASFYLKNQFMLQEGQKPFNPAAEFVYSKAI